MATKTVLETLEAARKLIEKPEHWTQGSFRNDSGQMCMLGAIAHVEGGNTCSHDRLYEVTRNVSLVHFNDNHTHAEVLAAFDAAIAKEKEAQHA